MMHAAQKILIVGFGDVGERLIKLLSPQIYSRHLQAYTLVRQTERAVVSRECDAIPIWGDLADRHSLRKVAGLADTVFHFAPPPNYGLHDIYTRNLISALSHQRRMLPQRLIYISTTGVYGNCNGRIIDETCRVRPATDRAIRRVDAETQLRDWGKRSGVSTIILRAPGIYAEDRLPIARLKNRTPVLLVADDVFTNHIHADDLARIAWMAASRGLPNRVYNVVDDTDLKMGDYFDVVADHFNLARAPRISRVDADKKISAPMRSFMNESRRISNARLKRELRLRLEYSDIKDFLKRNSER